MHRRRVSILHFLATAVLPVGGLGAQEVEVSGVVTDSASAPVEGAMVVALTLPDSLLTAYALTSGDGRFRIGSVAAGAYLLQVSRLGFATLTQPLVVETQPIDVGTLQLRVQAEEVEPLTVSVERVPFLMKGDTLAFNAAAFFTRPNATVEDLLRQLPGIEVDEDGSIRAQGEDVEKVLVDGKEFFGTDPTMATRNLPADAVKQVDVYDKRSDMAELTGVDDGEEQKTIDLRLKEEAKQGYFGRMGGGVGRGTDAVFAEDDAGRTRYKQSLSVNRFSPTVQLAAVARGGNLSSSGAAAVVTSDGGVARVSGGSGGGGLNRTLTLGLNAGRDFGEDRSLRANYTFGSNDVATSGSTRQQFLVDDAVDAVQNAVEDRRSESSNHALNLSGRYRFSEGHQLRLRSSLRVDGGESSRRSVVETVSSGAELRDSTTTHRSSSDDGMNGSLGFTWSRRLGEGGRSLVAEATVSVRSPDGRSSLASTGTRALNQEQTNVARTLTWQQRLAFVQPLGEGRTLEVNASRRTRGEDRTRTTVDLLESGPVVNPELSSDYDRRYTDWETGVRFVRTTDESRIRAGLAVEHTALDGTLEGGGDAVGNRFTNLLPALSLRRQFGEGRTLSLAYSTSSRAPSLTQLQPLVDNEDPLNVRIGNPDLEPAYTHSIQGTYRSFDRFSFVSLRAQTRVSWTTNDIVDARTFSPDGVRTVTPVNADRGWSARTSVNVDAPIRRIGAKASVGYSFTRSLSSSLVDGTWNDGTVLRHAPSITLENRSKERFDVRIRARLNFNDVNYSLSDRLDQHYADASWFASGGLFLGSWTLATDATLQRYGRRALTAGDRALVRWNASLRRRAFDDRLEIRLDAVDLLNENRGLTVVNDPSFIEERRTRTLGRYLMLNFSWRLGAGRGFGGR